MKPPAEVKNKKIMEWKMSIGSLREDVLTKLANMLDNSTRGWRQLANAMSDNPTFRCSESELTSCSLQVLSAAGSPGRVLLAQLADRSCSLEFLLHFMKNMDHQEAVQYLMATVAGLIQITVQPHSQQVTVGSKVVLTCRASGPLGLNYQWFKGKEEILDETGSTPDLVLCPITPDHRGHYICRVNQEENSIFSNWAYVGIVESKDCSSSLFPGSLSGLLITQQPQSQAVSEGDTLFLECSAVARPPAHYDWYHNKELMKEHKTRSLKIPCLTTAHRGQYRCRVFNLYHEAWTDTAAVTIGPSSISCASWEEVDCGLDSREIHRSNFRQGIHPLKETVSPSPSTKQFYATDKVALLIGNMNYHHHTQLRTPIADVHVLANLLRQIDFKVVSLLDLHCQEMHSAVTEFLLLLDKGVYGLLYFAGHGYENYGNSFMLPIDAPASNTSEHCLCVQNILTRMQEKETGLNVFLLDMCRKRNPNDDVIVQPELMKVTANIVFGYATCVDAEAYEVTTKDVSNGIFISFLKRRVCEDEKVTVMLDRVSEDMGRCKITRGRQALELRSNLSERRSLTDHIQTFEHSSASCSARNLQWAVAHVLPESLCHQFECGVVVQLGFAAEFSNVMVIYTRILEKPKEIVSCSAQLTDFPQDVDIDLKKSNRETLLEAGSLTLIGENFPSPEVDRLYTRIQSLQRLRRELTFTICLHYLYSNMDEEVQERQEVTVGKPLVSKLNLHEPRTPQTCSASSSLSNDSLSVSEHFSISDAFASVVSAQKTHSCNEPSGNKTFTTDSPPSSCSTNIPEETESPEVFDAPRPLVFNNNWKVNDIMTND